MKWVLRQRAAVLTILVVVIVGTAAAFALVRQPDNDDATPAATKALPSSSSSLPSSSGSSALPTTTAIKSPAVPKLVGDESVKRRPTAQNMARVGGMLNDYWATQFDEYPRFAQHTWRPVAELHVDEAATGICAPDGFSSLDYFCYADYYVGISVYSSEVSVDENTGKTVDAPPASTPDLNFTMAHEWGHAVQASAAIDIPTGKRRELQADCYAGLFLRHAHDRNLLSADDLDFAALSLASGALGDDVVAPTVGGDEHGTRAERRASFQSGWNGTPASCIR